MARPRSRLFCFPYAGGSATAYRDWSAALPSDVEVCAIQLPGRGERFSEVAPTTLAPTIDAVTAVIASWSDGAPYAFFGHSMGAVLAFEVTQRLTQSRPRHLFVSASAPPHVREHQTPLHRLHEDALVAALQRMGGLPEALLHNRELLELVLPTVRADLTAIETWSPPAPPPLDVPISAFGGDRDDRPRPADLETWRAQTRGAFALKIFSGGHFYFVDHLPEILSRVASAL